MTTLQISDKYFLNNENIYKLHNKFNRKEKKIEKKKEKKENIKQISTNAFFKPEFKDTIIWCWIIFYEGIKEYHIQNEFNNKNFFSYEKDVKINLISKLRKFKKELKKYKLKLTDIESNLMYEEKTSLNTIIALCVINSYNIIVLHDNIYWDIITNTENKTLCIKKEVNGYSINLEKIDIFELKKNRIVVENINKPLKAISSYKVNAIRDLCKKLNINIMKSPTKYKTKKDLYLLLQEQF